MVRLCWRMGRECLVIPHLRLFELVQFKPRGVMTRPRGYEGLRKLLNETNTGQFRECQWNTARFPWWILAYIIICLVVAAAVVFARH